MKERLKEIYEIATALKIVLYEEKLNDFDISNITKKAIKKNGVNDPVLVTANIQEDGQKKDLELLFEVESTADEHHKVDLKGNQKESQRGYAVVLRFKDVGGVLYENVKTKKHLYEYMADETLRNEVEEKIPDVLSEFGIDNKKLYDKLLGCLEGKKETWEDKLSRVFKSFGIPKYEDIVDAILKDNVKKEINLKNLKNNISKVVEKCDVVVHCDCPSFYYQGMQQDNSVNSNARYKFQGTGGSHIWTMRHAHQGGKTGKALCKHLQSVKEWMNTKGNLDSIVEKLG